VTGRKQETGHDPQARRGAGCEQRRRRAPILCQPSQIWTAASVRACSRVHRRPEVGGRWPLL